MENTCYTLPTLYMRNKKGDVKVWEVKVEGNTFTVSHGQLNGRMQHKSTSCKGKNIGRANETTPEQQAGLEAYAKYTKQRDKGYTVTMCDYVPVKNPMLAQDYWKMPNGIDWNTPQFTQYKLDGVRVLVTFEEGLVKFRSRGGKEYIVPPHLQEQLKTLAGRFNEPEKVVLDGELYIHGLPLQDLVSAVKKPNANSPRLTLQIFDIADETIEFSERLYCMGLINLGDLTHISIVETFDDVTNDATMFAKLDEAIEKGYEGLMVRASTGMYRYNYRVKDLVKVKRMFDEEFPITGHSIDKDGCVVWFVNVEGVTVKVTPKTDKATRRHWATCATDYYNKLLKVQYQAKTNKGSLQFPVGLAIRDHNLDEIV